MVILIKVFAVHLPEDGQRPLDIGEIDVIEVLVVKTLAAAHVGKERVNFSIVDGVGNIVLQ